MTSKTIPKQTAALARAAEAAFTGLREAHPEERFYFFALYTTSEGNYACATAWSEEALERAVIDTRKRDRRRSVDDLRRDLRFSAPDSPYHEAGNQAFAGRFKAGPALHRACFAALELLDDKGVFGAGAGRAKIVVNVVYGDMSHETWLAHATRLNPPAAIKRALPFLRLHVPSGRVTTWGGAAYQVNALSLSADRSRVAYSGSGGEVGILRTSTRKAIYETRRRGEHWASVLSPDGEQLYLGDEHGIQVLDATGKLAPFAKTKKPGRLAISPDGGRLAASSWDGPMLVFDTQSGRRLWQAKAVRKADLAFSPDGRWLAIAESRTKAKVSTAHFTCFDAATGEERWTSKFADGHTASVAWSPDGEAVLAAASAWTSYDEKPRATLAWLASKTGRTIRAVPWQTGAEAIAVAPDSKRIAVCSDDVLVIADLDGAELGRGTGGQESLIACQFLDARTVLAVGRNVNRGPAVLALTI